METQTVTKEELNKHTKDGDLWVLVDGKVYDVSEYMEDHPGGKEILLDNSGAKDASQAYQSCQAFSPYLTGKMGRTRFAQASKIAQILHCQHRKNQRLAAKISALSLPIRNPC